MGKTDEFIKKISFGKVAKIYVILSILVLIICIGMTAYLFRDKIALAIDYEKMDDAVEKRGIDASIKGRLDKLASDSVDIRDVILLDKENNILYRVRNSGIGRDNKLTLSYSREKGGYLTDPGSPDIYYKVVRFEKLIYFKDSMEQIIKLEKERNDDFFYDANFNVKKVYLLNYFADKNNGMKVFIISDIRIMPYAERLFESMGSVLAVILLIYWIGLALWVYKDSNEKRMNAALWGIVTLITNLIGLLVYVLVKQNSEVCYKCGAAQNKYNVYCYNCGAKINNLCSKCGAIVNEKDKYCIKCGNKL
ncbi:MAG: zinc ribbon domain-containing protein [Clostridiales bacterium]|nr:zinc ribbon domain-containing protein [Clostridiales bacterium]